MTPVAAYFLFVAEENERAAKASTFRAPRTSLLDRLRAIASTLRARPSVARTA